MTAFKTLALSTLLLAPALPALAGDGVPLPTVYVADPSSDAIVRLVDRDLDGDWNDAGEVTTYYDGVTGPLALSNPVALEMTANGTLYVADATEDRVFAFTDVDGDGDCNDPGEPTVFFDGNPGGNASGVEMSSAADLFLAPDGRFWIANANNGAGGLDSVFLIRDLNADGDANDLGEAAVYYALPGGSVGDSIPAAVALGADGALYYVENGSTGAVTKGLWRLVDGDSSGAIDQPGEATLFFADPSPSATPFHWDVVLGADGALYLPDAGNELVWRLADGDASGAIDQPGESVVWWAATGSSLIWQLRVAADGAILAAESQSPDRLLRFEDGDSSGTVDPVTEVNELWNDTLAATDIVNPRCLVIDPRGMTGFGVVACPGDGTGGACPCGNDSPVLGAGCLHSGSVGMRLQETGTPRVSADDLTLTAQDCPLDNAGIFFATTMPLPGGGAPLYDGLQCGSGDARRFQGRFQTTGRVSDTDFVAQDPSGVFFVAGTTYYFQYWSRDVAAPSPCGTNANLSSALAITYVP